MSWVLQAAEMPVIDVAAKLGLEARVWGSSVSLPCPACGAERRHRKTGDRRGSVGVDPRKPMAWRCFTCSEGGTTVDFVSFAIGGCRLKGADKSHVAAVRSFFLDDYRSWAENASREPTAPLTVVDENAAVQYPPEAELVALYDKCRRLEDEPAALAYANLRGLGDVRALVRSCRALPANAELPAWAHVSGVPWNNSGHRLLVPMYDYRGRFRTVIARSVVLDPARKSGTPDGYGRRGCIMASPSARSMLAVGRSRHPAVKGLRFVEGEVDFLRAVGTDQKWVLGIVSGSFTRDVASRIPSGSHVELATDNDAAGDRYAEQIRKTLGERCTYERVRMEDD